MISNHKKNVLLAGSFPPPEGGVASINHVIYHGFDDKPYSIILLDSSFLKRKIRVKSSSGIINLMFQCIQVMQFIYLVMKNNCKIIHVSLSSYHGFYKGSVFIMLAALLRKRKIIHLHSGDFKVFYQKHNKTMKRFIRYIFEKGDLIIVLSIYWKKILADDFDILPEKVTVLNNCYGYQFNDFIATIQKQLTERENNHINLLFIGEINENKGIFDLIKICKKLIQYRHDFILRIAGEEKLKGMKRKLWDTVDSGHMADSIKFMGEVRGEEKLRLFQQSDILILPSYSENFPVVIIEAMRMGLPILTTPVSSIPEIVANRENGYLIEPGDIRTFVDKIIDLSKNKKLREKMALRNQKKALAEYNPIHYVMRLSRIYDRVLKK